MSIQIISYAPKKTVSEEVVDDANANANAAVKYIGIDINNKITTYTPTTVPSNPTSVKSFGDTYITTQASTVHGFAVGVPFEIGTMGGLTWFSNNLNFFENPYNNNNNKKENISVKIRSRFGTSRRKKGTEPAPKPLAEIKNAFVMKIHHNVD